MNPHLNVTASDPIHGVLVDRGVVRISGPEAVAFLDKLVTNDLEGRVEGLARHAALLSPQGKVLFEFLVVMADAQTLLLDVDRAQAEALVKRLSLYKLRAKVEIADVSMDLAVALGTNGTTGIFADPRHPDLPRRSLVPASPGQEGASPSAYDALRIRLRVPELGRDYAPGEVVAHEALLDRTHGVSFTKGCYVGQEIVARMEHRGTARKRFVRVSSDGPLPAAGTEVRAGEALVGTMGSSVRSAGLALLRLDRLAEFAQRSVPLTAAGIAILPDAPDVEDLMPKAPDPVAFE